MFFNFRFCGILCFWKCTCTSLETCTFPDSWRDNNMVLKTKHFLPIVMICHEIEQRLKLISINKIFICDYFSESLWTILTRSLLNSNTIQLLGQLIRPVSHRPNSISPEQSNTFLQSLYHLVHVYHGFRINVILKHLRQFVQSDWFLPMFISHDRDTASGARIDPFKRRVLFSY